MKKLLFLFVALVLISTACTPKVDNAESEVTTTKVKMLTNYGEIVLELYNETPLHRDNFIKIVKEGVLDSLLFHRVIENFMIQGGDTGSKYAQSEDTLGNGDLPYLVPAEITPKLFHKKGALGAARDDHPERMSSSTQFYIVKGKVFNDSLLEVAEGRINGWLAEYFVKHDSLYSSELDSLSAALLEKDTATFRRINSNFKALAKEYTAFERYTIPEAQREIYKTVGGTPHLDQNYTVFGEVISGQEIVDQIAGVETSDLDRPLKDVRIFKIEIIEE
uniref:peptidylprolyl isomerase n=1 Tax=Fulvivirga sp. TaxID=1931237 RepID=UPI00404A4D24